jgi:hypothetical protein
MADLVLGAAVDASNHQRTDHQVAIATGDLATHAVIVGMTGSGKTGLALVLIEEVLSAGVPCILIDPKGDLGDLCLLFPNLAAADFRPWINDGDAAKAGVSPDEFAAQQAQMWKDGLAGWGITPERIAKLHDGADITIYTPGSTAGVPINIVGSLQAPANTSDVETMRDEIEGFVSGVLGMVGITADPLSSREHILLANLIETSWTAGTSLDLAMLVGQVQQPPIRKLGVFDLDTFYPPAERTALAMRLNGLLASTAFAAWAAGPPLDIDALLHTADGKPRAAIVSIAHLSDEERQFVVTLLLSKVVTWMRRQSGTTDLRALVYMDEVAGYLPPTAAPATKKPIMLLMKQARAFGVGVVLATQNPVDIDYKAIANAGTWMVGRLQTEQDKARLLDGMSAASGGVDVNALSDTIGGLAKREFVLRRAGKDAPELFTSRWAMSYLRGPLTRDQIASLTTAPAVTAAASAAAPTSADETVVMPEVASGVPVRWLDPAAPWAAQVKAVSGGSRLVAAVAARVRLRYDDTKADLLADEEYETIIHPLPATVDVSTSVPVDYDDRDLLATAPSGAQYALPDAPIKDKKFWTQLERNLIDHLVRNKPLEIFANRELELYSRVGETEADFSTRCRNAAEAQADAEAAKLRDKYEARARALHDQLETAQDRAQVLATQAKSKRSEEVLSAAGSLLGSFLGGRRSAKSVASKVLGGLGGAAGRRGRTAAAGDRVEAAHDKVARLEQGITDLETELQQEVTEISQRWDAAATQIAAVPVTLEKTDVSIVQLAVVWVPVG